MNNFRFQRIVAIWLILSLAILQACPENEDWYDWLYDTYDAETDCWIAVYDHYTRHWFSSDPEDYQDYWQGTENEEIWCDGEPNDPCGGTGCGTCNKFTAHDGNASRKIFEFQVPGAASGALSWNRYHNSIPRHGQLYFGIGGSWRHEWQYDLVEITPTPDGAKRLIAVLPDGARRIFVRDTTGWRNEGSGPDRLTTVPEGLEMKTGRGQRLLFIANAGSDGLVHYEMQKLTDLQSRTYTLTYQDGYLTKVTEPAGRSLRLTYRSHPFTYGAWTAIAKGEAAKGGQWVEIRIPETARGKAVQYFRIRGAEGASIAIAEIEIVGPDGKVIRPARLSGTGTGPENVADGNAATAFASNRASTNVLWIDLGKNPSRRADRIRILAAAGKEAAMKGALVEMFEGLPRSRMLLDEVSGSNGASVKYAYERMSDPITSHHYLVLKTATYADLSQARYQYEFVRAEGRPLLVQADDPRYHGPAQQIRYSYYDKLGMVHQELDPVTGGIYASLEVDSNLPDRRTIVYSADRAITYETPQNQQGRPATLVDSLGRTTKYEYEAGHLTKKTDHAGRQTRYLYDDLGRLSERQKPGKIAERVEYDGAGRVIFRSFDDGRQQRFARDEKGQLVSITDGAGVVRKFTRDSLGRIIGMVENDGSTHHFAYDQRGLRSSWTRPDGTVVSFGYDGLGRNTQITDVAGRVTRREINDRGETTKIVGPDGDVSEFIYDAYGRKTAETKLGKTVRFSYDRLNRISKREDSSGITTYDYADLPQSCSSCSLSSQPTRIVLPDGRVVSNLYDSEGRLLARTRHPGTNQSATTTYAYDNDNNLIAKVDPNGAYTRYSYDAQGRLVKVTDPVGKELKYTYNGRGRIDSITDGTVTTRYEFDEHGNVVSATDPNGNRGTFGYDAKNRLTTTRNAIGEVTSYHYDKLDRLVQVDDATGNSTFNRYDMRGRLIETQLPGGATHARTFDALGRVASEKMPDGLITSFSYDAWNRITGKEDTLGNKERYQYGSTGKLLAVQRGFGNAWKATFDDQDRLLSFGDESGSKRTFTYTGRRIEAATDAAGNTTKFSYGPSGDIKRVTDRNGHFYEFTYDLARNLTGVTYPSGAQERWTYDQAGQLSAHVVPSGAAMTVVRDPAGRPAKESWTPANAAMEVSFAYDSSGNLVALTNQNSAVRREYDAINRITSTSTDYSSLNLGPINLTTRYAYDKLGRPMALTYPDGSQAVRTFDSRGRINSIAYGTLVLVKYEYDTAGRVAKASRNNGVVTTYEYNQEGRVLAIEHKTPGGVVPVKYLYGSNGQPEVREVDKLDRQVYQYDVIGQLLGVAYQRGDAAVPESRTDMIPPAIARTRRSSQVLPRNGYEAPSIQ